MAGEPQSDVQFAVVPMDYHLSATSGIADELGLFAVPDGVNFQVEILSLSIRAHVLVTAATMDLEWVNDSAADAVADLQASIDLNSDVTVLVGNTVWRGSQILDPGDALNGELSVTDVTAPGEGYVAIVEYRVLRRS